MSEDKDKPEGLYRILALFLVWIAVVGLTFGAPGPAINGAFIGAGLFAIADAALNRRARGGRSGADSSPRGPQ
jgi:hypothetical protein